MASLHSSSIIELSNRVKSPGGRPPKFPFQLALKGDEVGTRSTQGVFAHRPVAALPTTTNVLMLPVHVGRGALASNLVRQLKNLTFPIRRKRNPALRIRVVQDTVGHWTS
jgi:hypothetical protein